MIHYYSLALFINDLHFFRQLLSTENTFIYIVYINELVYITAHLINNTRLGVLLMADSTYRHLG